MVKIPPCHGAWSEFESRTEDMCGVNSMWNYNPQTTKTIKTIVTEEIFDEEGRMTKRITTETTETTTSGGYGSLPPVYSGGSIQSHDTKQFLIN